MINNTRQPMKLTNEQITFLNKHGWNAVYTNGILEISNAETGCRFASAFSNDDATLFAIEKIKEISEETNTNQINPNLTEEQILEGYGYSIICESPFELHDPKNELITGECALWLKQTLIQRYKESLALLNL